MKNYKQKHVLTIETYNEEVIKGIKDYLANLEIAASVIVKENVESLYCNNENIKTLLKG